MKPYTYELFGCVDGDSSSSSSSVEGVIQQAMPKHYHAWWLDITVVVWQACTR